MPTAGHWPEPAFKKYSPVMDHTVMIDIAYGSSGWFDDHVHAVMVDHNGRLWLAGQYGLAYSDDKGLSWKKSITEYTIYEIFETRKHTLLASSDNSFVLRSEDNGKTWTHQKALGKDGRTGKSSHGERYSDIFYLQVDDKNILRTTQYSDELLLSDDEGISWKKVKGPDHPEEIYNIGDSVLVMFTYDEMYISENKGKNWKKEHDGLPKPKDEMYEMVDCGVVMEDGFILALIDPYDPEEQDEYFRQAYTFDLKTKKWKLYEEAGHFDWSQDGLLDLGENRILTSDYEQGYSSRYFQISFDKGITWSEINGEYESNSYITDFYVDDDVVWMIIGTSLVRVNFPKVCVEEPLHPKGAKNLPVFISDSLTIFSVPENKITDSLALYQKCDSEIKDCATFFLHVPEDGIFTGFSIYTKQGDETTDFYKMKMSAELKAGDYELLFYHKNLTGSFMMHSEFKMDGVYKDALTVCFFY